MNQSAIIAAPDKATVCAMLDRWVRQRPGLEFGNYGDATTYRAELRGITRDGAEAKQLLRYVENAGSITGQDIAQAFPHAFSGRLTLRERKPGEWALDYCTGQYWPTEYRRAACAVLASVIWDYWRDNMPAPDGFAVDYLRGINATARSKVYATREEAQAYAATVEKEHNPYIIELIRGHRPGDYLRAKAVREFGRGIASRWFR